MNVSPASARPLVAPSSPYELFIGGEWIAPRRRYPLVDPSTGEEWAQAPQGGPDEVEQAVAAARDAFPAWRRTSPARRQELLWTLSERVAERAERWALLQAVETGRPIREAVAGDVPVAVDMLRFYAGLARDLRGDHVPVEDPDTLVYGVREPLGVVAALIPWNSPIISVALKAGPALACGNTVVLKPSEYASATALEFARAVEDVLPPGVLNVVTGDGPGAGAALVAHPDVAKISFTGGQETARRILAAGGAALTPALIELGGKGAMVVCPDADLELAVHDALTGVCAQNGQCCVASARLMVHASVADAFTARLLERVEAQRIGDALDPATQVGPLVSHARREAITSILDRARGEGAEVLTGGGPPPLPAPLDAGAFLAPTVFRDPAGTTAASREEFFGPVTVLETWTDEDDVVARANETRYGLAHGVWTRDLATAHRIGNRLDAGVVWINKWFDLPVGSPLGGVKDSGFGREAAAETVREYSATKVFNFGLSDQRPPLWS